MRQIHIPAQIVIGRDSIDLKLSISIDHLLSDALAEPAVTGRPRKLTKENAKLLRALISTESVDPTDLADAFGLSRTTLWRYRKRFEREPLGGPPS